MLNAMCPACYKEQPITQCHDWRGWEYDKKKKKAYGLCESCKMIFKLYDGTKSIETMIDQHHEAEVDISLIVCMDITESEE